METQAHSRAGEIQDERIVKVVLSFLRASWLRVATTSIALLLPCFWHRRIEAGDLASHVYNAWLAQLVERGQAPGLYFARQWNNVACDIALTRLGNIFGFAAAEKIVVSACVLVFFWGAFALISAAARQAPWPLAPCLAMLAYGYTFHMGFLNYYLSLGLAFFGLAIVWRARGSEWLWVVALLALAFVAHPIGFLWLIGAGLYVRSPEFLRGRLRLLAIVVAGIALLGARFYLGKHYETSQPAESRFFFNGSDQFILFGERYAWLAWAALALGAACFLKAAISRGSSIYSGRGLRLALELYGIAFLATALLPENIRVPWYAGWIGLLIARLTVISATLGLCILACLRREKWHVAGFGLLALVFFAMVYRDTGALNRMEEQAQNLVRGLPYGRRVLATIWAPSDSRVWFVGHLADRACIGRCFSYGNYEPSSGEFRVRVRPGSPIVTASADDAEDMASGEYEVQEEDLPIVQIYQCDPRDLTKLCLRELSAGEVNGQIGYHPPR